MTVAASSHQDACVGSALAPVDGALQVLTGLEADAADDVGVGPALLQEAADRGHGGWLRVYRPGPTVAFSRRDGLNRGFRQAVEASAVHGFTPVLRAPGGRAVAYHEGALCLELVVADADSHAGATERFRELAEVLVEALTSLGVDARVGAVPDEYCPGRYSVNGAGRVKLAGTAQRVVRGGWFLGAVLLVDGAGPVRDVIDPVYRALGLPCDVTTIGSVSQLCAGIEVDDVSNAVLAALSRRIRLQAAHHPDDLLRRARGSALQHPALPGRRDDDRAPFPPPAGGDA
jgi:octanoyl-[GcvH]:protein N-octanoyltransferase